MPAEAPRSPSDSTVPGADALPTLLRKLVLLGIAVGAMFALACGGGNPDVGQLKTGPRGAGAIPQSNSNSPGYGCTRAHGRAHTHAGC